MRLLFISKSDPSKAWYEHFAALMPELEMRVVPCVHQGPPIGSTDRDLVAEVVRPDQPRLDACLDSVPDHKSVGLWIDVGVDGQVASVEPMAHKKNRYPKAERCIAKVVGGWRFPASDYRSVFGYNFRR